jgi:hydroxymethylbilane synthase
MRTGLVVGSRGSRLALVQTGMIIARLRELYPDLKISLLKIVTAGDKDRRTTLEQLGVDVFVKELEEALLDHRIDLAVHSLKDVPTDIPAGLNLLAVPERADPRDVLVAKSKLASLPAGSKIGTGSLRRSLQLTRYRPDLVTVEIRGNVDTRLRKVETGAVDGVILAAAGVIRLGAQDRITEYLPLTHFLPSVGQGALVLEARKEDSDIAELVTPLNHLPSWQSVRAERAFLLTLGGGCRAPIAALAVVQGGVLNLDGMVASLDGSHVSRDSIQGKPVLAEELGGRLAAQMLKSGASEFIDELSKTR